jgi:hypothetical protein
MNTELTNRVTMFKTVDSHLDDNNSIWSVMPQMQTSVTKLKSKLVAIDRTAQLQELPSGAADDKEAARDALEDVLFLTCEALAVLAHTGNDHELLALVAVRPSTLSRFNDEELSNRAASVLAEANARKTALAALNVTQANLDELTQALERFNTSKTSPRTATAAKKVQTASLAGLVRETNSILRNETDKLVNLFVRTNPEFVAGYRAARVIVDRGIRHTKKKTGDVGPPETS